MKRARHAGEALARAPAARRKGESATEFIDMMEETAKKKKAGHRAAIGTARLQMPGGSRHRVTNSLKHPAPHARRR